VDYTNFEKHLKTISSKIDVDSGLKYHEAVMDSLFENGIKQGSFKKALDVGIGVGYALNKFKEAGIDVIGISQGEKEVEEAKSKGFDARLMDMNFLDFPDYSFNLVWCRHALEHSVMPIIALMEFHRVLDDDGVLFVEVPMDNVLHIENVHHYSLFADATWQALFRKVGFKTVQVSQVNINFGSWTDISWQYWLRK
jgi:SAM-dependent methyltransferase